MIHKFVWLTCAALSAQGAVAGLLMTPTADPDLVYQGTILEGDYDDSIAEPSFFLGFEAGQRVASPAQISAAINAWKGQSDRLKVVEYART
ncbi:MAG TPA: hypothetical protein DD655_05810, partial [Halieaceae bacterium]|nr:hypothetical protein [Halieaceae bacterium]